MLANWLVSSTEPICKDLKGEIRRMQLKYKFSFKKARTWKRVKDRVVSFFNKIYATVVVWELNLVSKMSSQFSWSRIAWEISHKLLASMAGKNIVPVHWRILQLKDIARSGVLIRGGGDVVNISPALGTRRWSWRWRAGRKRRNLDCNQRSGQALG